MHDEHARHILGDRELSQLSKRGELCIIGIVVLQLMIISPTTCTTQYPQNSRIQGTPVLAQTYVDHAIIAILGNDDLLQQAAMEGWEGSGSAMDPIVISGYRITDNRHLFRIVNTDLHFIFTNNFLDGISGDWCGLYLANVTNGMVSGNIVRNAAIALHMVQIYNCTLEANVIYDNFYDGIVLELPCTGITLIRNHIFNNAESGIVLDYGCQSNLVANNTIHNNGGNGIYLWQFVSEPLIQSNTIISNDIAHNPVGISVQGYRNTISNNCISESGRTGILCSGRENEIEYNTVEHGGRDGISLYSYASNNTVMFNSIGNNTEAGIEIDSRSHDNLICYNDLIENNLSLQACDAGEDNTFLENYYSNWNTPDVNQDGHVDHAYPIFGRANNTDAYPSTMPNTGIPVWHSYSEMTATITTASDQNTAMLFLLPASGVVILIAMGVLFPRKGTK